MLSKIIVKFIEHYKVPGRPTILDMNINILLVQAERTLEYHQSVGLLIKGLSGAA